VKQFFQAGMTALILASCFGHIDCIRLLLSQNPLPDIDAQDNEGMTATMHAAFAGNTEAVKLISAMCEPNLALRNKVSFLNCVHVFIVLSSEFSY
jgi:ankyrin repeat protein